MKNYGKILKNLKKYFNRDGALGFGFRDLHNTSQQMSELIQILYHQPISLPNGVKLQSLFMNPTDRKISLPKSFQKFYPAHILSLSTYY